MKFYRLPAWAALALAGSLLIVPTVQANAPTASRAVSALPTVPASLTAVGLAHPIGSQIQLSWRPLPWVSECSEYKVYRDGRFLASSGRAGWVDYSVAAGETHAYTITSLTRAGESRPSSSATATVPGGGGQVVYADSLQNGWQSWSWASCDLSSGNPVRAGRAIRVTAGPWQAFYLHHAPFGTSAYAAVTFWVQGGSQGGQRLWVRALRSGIPQAPVAVGPLPADRWQSITVSLADLGVANVTDMDGLWVQDATGTAQSAFSLDEIALTPAAILAAPVGLTATPQWAAHCPKCSMAMPHIVLAWNAVPGASSYTVYRDGSKLQDGMTDLNWTDMAVVSGRTYAYTVTSNAPGGSSPQSAQASATAPQPPASGQLTAPTNLSVAGTWLGAPSDTLTWSPVPGAMSYNLYQYDVLIAKDVTANSYAVPADTYYFGLTYTVTAVDGMGMESLPSAVATAQGRYDPAATPPWTPNALVTPTNLAATPEWNAGAPRIHLTWKGWDTDFTYTVYRDGQKVEAGLWGLNFYDGDVKPGETHVYRVSGVNVPWTGTVESAPSEPLMATAFMSAPTPAVGAVQITNIQPNDDSVLVSFAPVLGAVDYRVYDVSNPGSVKYSGGGLSIEMNGLDPIKGANLVVEAVDKLGPFQKMDGMTGPGAMQMDGMHSSVNGQGDPSNIPIVLAASAPFPVTCRPAALDGSQVFFDNFRAEQPLTPQPMPAPAGPEFYGRSDSYAEFANDKWTIRNYGGDLADTRIFFMGSHFMDTLYDGGTPHTNDPIHNNNASLVLMPHATADISGGRVLHVTFEVDAHFDARRWCEIQIAAAGDLLVKPGKFDPGDGTIRGATLSGNSLRWQIENEFHHLILFQNDGAPAQPVMRETNLINVDWATGGAERFGPAARICWDGTPLNNGTAQGLDKRRRFDMYLSQTHYRLLENGQLVKDADFPAGQSLPFDKCQVYFVHQLYHTTNDRNELVDYYPANRYWSNYRPWCDERHWDNLGQAVLDHFPALP